MALLLAPTRVAGSSKHNSVRSRCEVIIVMSRVSIRQATKAKGLKKRRRRGNFHDVSLFVLSVSRF